MFPPKRTKVEIPLRHDAEARPVPIVADGSIARAGTAGSRLVPVLIIDTSHRQDVEVLVRAHTQFGPGDVNSFWMFKRRPFALDLPRLVLQTTKPSACVIVIDFDFAERQGVLVDLIHSARGVYLQPGRPGDKLTATMHNPRILVEVPSNPDFERVFRRLYEKATIRRFRKTGMKRTAAKRAARSFLAETRKVMRSPLRTSSERDA